MSSPSVEPYAKREHRRRRAGVGPRHPLDENLLARHQAKVLRAEDAVPAADGSPAPPTVYRYEWLLIPNKLVHPALDETKFRRFLIDALKRIDLNIDLDRTLKGISADEDIRVPCQLDFVEGQTPRYPIDAWHALQAVSRAAVEDDRKRAVEKSGPARLSRVGEVLEISLNHLFFGATMVDQIGIEGTPGKEGHSGGLAWGPARLPAFVPLPALAPHDPNGPVIAVLDTGCWKKHPWLGDAVDIAPPHIAGTWADPETWSDLVEPLLGVTDSHSGHGTFMCGVIRQIEPTAKIIVFPVMHSDGIVDEADLDHQIDQIIARGKINIVVMPFGGYASAFTGITALKNKLKKLWDAGVILVASAGNDASSEHTYPAAFESVVGVGALTRRHTIAIFSNEDTAWVDTWYPGSSIVSTLPPYHGSYTPQFARPPMAENQRPREGFDPDNHAYHFGVWNGTSFAAAIAAARAAHLLNRMPPLPVGTLTQKQVQDRAKQVREGLVDEGRTESWPP